MTASKWRREDFTSEERWFIKRPASLKPKEEGDHRHWRSMPECWKEVCRERWLLSWDLKEEKWLAKQRGVSYLCWDSPVGELWVHSDRKVEWVGENCARIGWTVVLMQHAKEYQHHFVCEGGPWGISGTAGICYNLPFRNIPRSHLVTWLKGVSQEIS